MNDKITTFLERHKLQTEPPQNLVEYREAASVLLTGEHWHIEVYQKIHWGLKAIAVAICETATTVDHPTTAELRVFLDAATFLGTEPTKNKELRDQLCHIIEGIQKLITYREQNDLP